MKKFILPSVLCLVFLLLAASAAAAFAGAERADRAMNETYRAALDEAFEELEEATLALEKLLVSADPTQQAVLLSRISRAGEDIGSALSRLPGGESALAQPLAFANHLSDYAASLLYRVVSGERLESGDRAQLEDELTACVRFSGELALADQSGEASLSLSDPAVAFPELRYTGAFSRSASAPALTGDEIGETDAARIARAFTKSEVTAEGKISGPIRAYLFSGSKDGLALHIAVTASGGRLLWMTPEQAAFEPLADASACAEAADAWLISAGFSGLALVWQESAGGICRLTYAAMQDDTILYADLVHVQVRMDQPAVIALDAAPYWQHHTRRDLPAPALSAGEAAALISPEAQVSLVRRCLLPLYGTEALCYECRATRSETDFLIYLDAQTGREVLIRRIVPAPGGSKAA